MMDNDQMLTRDLEALREKGNFRQLPSVEHLGRWVRSGEKPMLNLSSNDYLGLATDESLRKAFMEEVSAEDSLLSSSSSRLLTGNFAVHDRLERLLAESFGKEAALVFSSGYHMNTGILPAVADAHTLILADKLVHASLIDGIRLSAAKCIRFRHQDYAQLEALLQKHHADFHRILIVTESIFSMDGDVAPLQQLVELKQRYPGTMLYVDEAHAIGVRGQNGLGVAEEQACIPGIDFLCGTFGKAVASVGAYVACSLPVRNYLINRMRTLIFTTALPPLNVAWTEFIVKRLPDMNERRKRLATLSEQLRTALKEKGYACPSESHIVPMLVGASKETVLKAEELQRKGFYVLPVRPPTVPEGTSRLRFSLTATLSSGELEQLIDVL